MRGALIALLAAVAAALVVAYEWRPAAAVVLAVVAVAALFSVLARVMLMAAAAAGVVATAVTVWDHPLLLALAAAAVAARPAVACARFAWASPATRRHYPAMVRARIRWRYLARNTGLAPVDYRARNASRGESAPMDPLSRAWLRSREPRGAEGEVVARIHYPPAKFRADDYGFRVDVRTVPGVSVAEAEKAAPHLANYWRCARIAITAPEPGRLRLRAVRRDPLTESLPAVDVLPASFDGRHLVLGRDEWGTVRRVSLSNLSGSVISGNPGQGKTESALSMAVQLVPSDLVDLHIIDGGACDWAPFAGAAATYADGDIDEVHAALDHLHHLMMTRRKNLEADLGTRNAWARGPSPDYRLQWLLLEEASAILDLETVKGDRAREAKVRAIRGLVLRLLQRGRAPMFHTTVICQKATGSAGCPPDIRDLAGLRWCFGVATTEVAVGGLGDDIRNHGTLNPVQLQGEEHTGVATVLLKTNAVPYTLVRFPAIGQDLADNIARSAARQSADRPALRVVAG